MYSVTFLPLPLGERIEILRLVVPVLKGDVRFLGEGKGVNERIWGIYPSISNSLSTGCQVKHGRVFWYCVKSVTSKMSSVTRFILSHLKIAALS